MRRKTNLLLWAFLVVALLSGCFKNEAIAKVGSPPAAEISSSKSNEDSGLSQNVHSGVDAMEVADHNKI